MQQLNEFNWQYMVRQQSNRKTPINDFESMMIGSEMRKIRADSLTPKLLKLVSINLTVNLYSSVVTTKDGKTKVLERAATNNRNERQRPETTERSVEVSLVIQPKQQGFARKIAAYSQEWGIVYKEKATARPSFNELMEGLFEWYNMQV